MNVFVAQNMAGNIAEIDDIHHVFGVKRLELTLVRNHIESLSIDSVTECDSVLVNVSFHSNRNKERMFEFISNRSI